MDPNSHAPGGPLHAGRSAFYRLARVSAADEPVVTPAGDGDASARVAEAQTRAEQRLRSQRDTLRPLGLATLAIVAVGSFNAHPKPSGHGTGLWVAAALASYAAALAVAIRGRFIERPTSFQLFVIAVLGAAGVALAGLQPHGPAELATGAAVWMAVARFDGPLGLGLGALTAAAVGIALALAGGASTYVLSAMLLCALFGVVAYFLAQSRASQARTEVLLAQLEDAREEQTRAAAVAERGRIASELHDVLAHSLSGAAIQLQGARMLAERSDAPPKLRDAVDRAGALVRDGLAEARQAVGALRGEQLPGVEMLPSLVDGFAADMEMAVSLTVEGEARLLPAEAGLALYRGAQEALTNVARYAPGATTNVVLSYLSGRVGLRIEDVVGSVADRARPGAGLTGVGGGRGLDGMRERVQRAGGTVEAGPTENGWRVELQVPA